MISVIVPVRQAKHTVRETLDSLLSQQASQPFEIVVAVSECDPCFSIVSGGYSDRVRLISRRGRCGIPQLRRDAVLAAKGDWIVITEDHCRFAAGWLHALVAATEHTSGQICGGPVANGCPSLRGWAQYFTRYSSFLPTLPAGPVNNLPGNNACYPMRLLADRAGEWDEGFWEAELNRSLAAQGIQLVLLPELVATQFQHRGMFEYMALRLRHGRCYGARRVRGLSATRRLRLIAVGPLLPSLLIFRVARAVLRSRRNTRQFCLGTPLIILYLLAWSVGEVLGYLAGAGNSCTETD